ncbi:MAG: cytidylate kinase-like family protein [Oscillospiraceae bacterium]|nr:cytidylate kinase-like family protein [Oscillospiraceae bacterium]
MNKIITVGREFGSGGRELGRRLAEELGVQYYDKEIISEIAKNMSLSEDYVRSVVESKPHRLFPITIGHSFSAVPDYQLMQMQGIYMAQTEIIHELADKGDCVIIGRCADFILKDKKPFRLFVHADMDSRIKRCIERQQEGEDLTVEKTRRQIIAIDKDRASYYNDFTGQKWGDKRYYDLCINTTGFVIKEIVPYIAKLF